MLARPSRSLLISALASVSLLALVFAYERKWAWSTVHQPQIRVWAHDQGAEAPIVGGKFRQPDISASSPEKSSRNATNWSGDPQCAGFPDTAGILVIMKTGASESFARLPTQLMAALRCLPDFLLFSDMAEDVAGYHVYDSLDTVLVEAKRENPEFDIYRRQRDCLVDPGLCSKLGDPAREGWDLDKYKNIHMAEKAYALRPDYDYYFFVDADTYVVWPNVVQWLRQLPPTDKKYLGNVARVHDMDFGHGGSGYILTRALMAEFVGSHEGVANQYDVRTKSECCGDYMLALAVKETCDVTVHHAWPALNGDKPSTLPFHPGLWCQPIATMHKMSSQEISTMWAIDRRFFSEQASSHRRPLLARDIYHEFVASRLHDAREDWDNQAEDVYYLDRRGDHSHTWEDWQLDKAKDEQDIMNEAEKTAHLGFRQCRAACESLGVEECLSFKWTEGACSTARSFRLGSPVKRDAHRGRRVMSGWLVARIDEWVAEQPDCLSPSWPAV